MEKIKVVNNLIELSQDDQLLVVDMESIDRVQQDKEGCEISLLGGDVFAVDQNYEDIVKAWEAYYTEKRMTIQEIKFRKVASA